MGGRIFKPSTSRTSLKCKLYLWILKSCIASNPLQVYCPWQLITLALLTSNTLADPSGILFCRFARSVSQDGIVVMPLAPHLLDRRNRQKLDGFPETSVLSVVDLSPNILGPLEGFVNTGCTAFAGIGFDEEHDSTWRVSLQSSKLSRCIPANQFDKSGTVSQLPSVRRGPTKRF